jgi:hypothetical protein
VATVAMIPAFFSIVVSCRVFRLVPELFDFRSA